MNMNNFLGFSVYRFLVSWFLVFFGFEVCCVCGFGVIGFKVSRIYKNTFHVFRNIEPISKIFKILLDGLAGFVGARFFSEIANTPDSHVLRFVIVRFL